MARCVGRMLNFVCLTCGAELSQFCWRYTDPHDQSKNTPYPSDCGNPECPQPHMTWVPKYRSAAQVRESQRAVVYLTPDGDYMVPESNDPDAPSAQTALSAGGVRLEFNSIYEMRDFQKRKAYEKLDQWERIAEDGGYDIQTPDFKRYRDAMYEVARNQVLDYDQKSLEENRDRLQEVWEEKRKHHEEFLDKFRSLKIGRHGDNERYERLRRGR